MMRRGSRMMRRGSGVMRKGSGVMGGRAGSVDFVMRRRTIVMKRRGSMVSRCGSVGGAGSSAMRRGSGVMLLSVRGGMGGRYVVGVSVRALVTLCMHLLRHLWHDVVSSFFNQSANRVLDNIHDLHSFLKLAPQVGVNSVRSLVQTN
jgi:hypothetical protein